jgi:hypothetical protein
MGSVFILAVLARFGFDAHSLSVSLPRARGRLIGKREPLSYRSPGFDWGYWCHWHDQRERGINGALGALMLRARQMQRVLSATEQGDRCNNDGRNGATGALLSCGPRVTGATAIAWDTGTTGATALLGQLETGARRHRRDRATGATVQGVIPGATGATGSW